MKNAEKFLIGFLVMVGVLAVANEMTHAEEKLEKATFAGGCFWCMQPPYDKLEGVVSVVAGYTGGAKPDPTYDEVSSGTTGHREAVEVSFDPEVTTYKELLAVFWQQIDPTNAYGQFADMGPQYKTAIYYHDERQKREAEESRKGLDASGKFPSAIVTDILKAGPFYKAEDYHQNYYKKNAAHYEMYKKGSGRKDFLERTWGNGPAAAAKRYAKPAKDEIRKKLTPAQFKVTQQCGTEPPFKNEYWNNKREGIYVDVVTGEPLFSSTDKFDSGTGWPSFTKPIDASCVKEQDDNMLAVPRREIRSEHGGSHLGHVFDDGPEPGGVRYCINSSALRFIPKEDLRKEGYEEYLEFFKK